MIEADFGTDLKLQPPGKELSAEQGEHFSDVDDNFVRALAKQMGIESSDEQIQTLKNDANAWGLAEEKSASELLTGLLEAEAEKQKQPIL